MIKSIWVLAWRWKESEWKRGITKQHKETFGDVGYIHYLDYGNSFTDVCISKLIKLYTSTKWSLLCQLNLNKAVFF